MNNNVRYYNVYTDENKKVMQRILDIADEYDFEVVEYMLILDELVNILKKNCNDYKLEKLENVATD